MEYGDEELGQSRVRVARPLTMVVNVGTEHILSGFRHSYRSENRQRSQVSFAINEVRGKCGVEALRPFAQAKVSHVLSRY